MQNHRTVPKSSEVRHSMRISLANFSLVASSLLLAGVFGTVPATAADAGKAKLLAGRSGCLKCHAEDKQKDGPAYRDVAARYKGNAGAQAKLIHHITSGEKVKFADGHEEDHAIVKSTKPEEIANLVDWILSLEGGKAN
ncbi:MAG: c-type cytochrome [Steroidobacteraceae bacterium]